MRECPYCHDTENQVRADKTGAGRQRYKCKPCNRRYTPEPSQFYSDALRKLTVKLSADGLGYRRIARHLEVDHVTVMNWGKAQTDQLPDAPVPAENPLHIVEMDELYTVIGQKKTATIS